jgi:hypothetical protein
MLTRRLPRRVRRLRRLRSDFGADGFQGSDARRQEIPVPIDDAVSSLRRAAASSSVKSSSWPTDGVVNRLPKSPFGQPLMGAAVMEEIMAAPFQRFGGQNRGHLEQWFTLELVVLEACCYSNS